MTDSVEYMKKMVAELHDCKEQIVKLKSSTKDMLKWLDVYWATYDGQCFDYRKGNRNCPHPDGNGDCKNCDLLTDDMPWDEFTKRRKLVEKELEQ